jgi:hypothetical protein
LICPSEVISVLDADSGRLTGKKVYSSDAIDWRLRVEASDHIVPKLHPNLVRLVSAHSNCYPDDHP